MSKGTLITNGVGKVGNIVVSGVVDLAKRYEAAGRALVAARDAVDEYLNTPEYIRLQENVSNADAEWRKLGEDFNEARIK